VFGALAAKLRRSQRDPHVWINDPWLATQAIQCSLKLLTSKQQIGR
jgi:hypothetical protein